jgi:hypothetical protein
MFTAVLRMNPREALEWLLENRAEEESEDAADLKQEAASGCLKRQQEAVASGKMRFGVLTAATVNITIVLDVITCGRVEATILEEYAAFIPGVGDSTFLQNINEFLHDHRALHPRTWYS